MAVEVSPLWNILCSRCKRGLLLNLKTVVDLVLLVEGGNLSPSISHLLGVELEVETVMVEVSFRS